MQYWSLQILIAMVMSGLSLATGTPIHLGNDLPGNRRSFTNCSNRTTDYALANTGNEYSTIGGATVGYDAAGNLTSDEQGRYYDYDEQNRLTQVRASNGTTVLASYLYDALGRRIAATINGVVTRYYYDGQKILEERNAGDVRVRYHVNGSQYVDERVATYSVSAGAFRYYLLSDTYSVAGSGGADGSAIERLSYSALGDFASSTTLPGDINDDGYVNATDLQLLVAAWNSLAGPPPSGNWNPDADLNYDNIVNIGDMQIVVAYWGRSALGLPASGTFAMHGRPVDVIQDSVSGQPLVLQDFRARLYDVKNGRWLQRDPLGYVDGSNLYEAFGSNATSYLDPNGQGILSWLLLGDYNLSDWGTIKSGSVTGAAMGFGQGAAETVVAGAKDLIRIPSGTSSAQTNLVHLVEALGKYGGTSSQAETMYLAVGQGLADFVGLSSGEAAIAGSKPVFTPGGEGSIANLSGFERLQEGVSAVGQASGTVAVVAGGVRTVAGRGTPVTLEVALSRGAALRAQYGENFAEYSRFRGQGFTPAQAKYLTEPYEGMGHHFLPRRWNLPEVISESPLNVMKLERISIGRFYERHYFADLNWKGTRFPEAIGGSWSGRAIGLQRPGFVSRLWYASPTSLKWTVGGAAAGGVGAVGWWMSGDGD